MVRAAMAMIATIVKPRSGMNDADVSLRNEAGFTTKKIQLTWNDIVISYTLCRKQKEKSWRKSSITLPPR